MVGDQEVGSIRQDGEEEAHGDAMGQERACPTSRGREAFYEGEGGLGQGQAAVEVVRCVQGRRQPVAKPFYHPRRVEDLAVEGYGGEGGGDLSLWVRQWISSVLGTEKERSSSEALLEVIRKRLCRRLMLDL